MKVVVLRRQAAATVAGSAAVRERNGRKSAGGAPTHSRRRHRRRGLVNGALDPLTDDLERPASIEVDRSPKIAHANVGHSCSRKFGEGGSAQQHLLILPNRCSCYPNRNSDNLVLLSGSNSVVESRLPKPLVAGSIPVSRSILSIDHIELYPYTYGCRSPKVYFSEYV
jgi:hypothetical protein